MYTIRKAYTIVRSHTYLKCQNHTTHPDLYVRDASSFTFPHSRACDTFDTSTRRAG